MACEMEPQTDNNTLFELTPKELSIPLKAAHAGRSYRVAHRLRPPQAEDWFTYERALKMSVEELSSASGEESEEEVRYRLDVRSADAALALWDRLALGVEGYQYPAGDWCDAVPLAHKEAAVRSLTLVALAELSVSDSTNNESTDNYFPLAAEEVPVVLEAARGGAAYPRLVHIFRPPAVEDERRYRRLMAEMVIVGGTKHPRTLLPARLPALCRLYDSLIFSAEGYTLEGANQITRDGLLRHMDAWHKRTAVQSLFGDATDATDATDEEIAQEQTAEVANP